MNSKNRFIDKDGDIKKTGKAKEFADKVDNRKVNERTLQKELEDVGE